MVYYFTYKYYEKRMFVSGNGLKISFPNLTTETNKNIIAIKPIIWFKNAGVMKRVVDLSDTGLAQIKIIISVKEETIL